MILAALNLDPHPDLTSSVIVGLGWWYFILFLMNLGWSCRSFKAGGMTRLPDILGGMKVPTAAFWFGYSALLLMVSGAHLTGSSNPDDFSMILPQQIRTLIDALLSNPTSYFMLAVAGFVAVILLRKFLVKPTVAWIILNFALIFMAFSMTDYDFRQIVGKPDNVPIVSMLFIVGFFTWLYFKRAVDNDRRIEEGRELFEKEDNEKILVWPDLVYTELICMILCTVILVAWGLLLQAPLEEPSSSVKTPNPSKAPWYFLGLQEMLVYFDPWLAGVVFPSMILVGLMAIPYIDFNKKGNGYYTFNERKFAVITFMFGFMPMWIAMIILGTFLRGPNWNFFGIYEFWDVHKLEALTNVNLSEFVWDQGFKTGLPKAPAGAGGLTNVLYILYRESAGFVVLLFYFGVMPFVLAATILKKFFYRMGFIRYMVFSNLLLLMAALPIKMILRWSINLKYIVAIPEWFLNV